MKSISKITPPIEPSVSYYQTKNNNSPEKCDAMLTFDNLNPREGREFLNLHLLREKRGSSENFFSADKSVVHIKERCDKPSSITIEKRVYTPPLRSAPHSPPDHGSVGFRFPSDSLLEKPRLNSSFTSPSIVNVVKRRASRVISYGYASLYPFREEFDDEFWYEEYCDADFVGTSSIADDTLEECRITPTPSKDAEPSQNMTLFFLRLSENQRVIPAYCFQPLGVCADHFIQSLSDRQRDLLQKFALKEKPEEGECYLWIREDVTMRTTVISLKALENHFKNDNIRRVKWRHLSSDKVQVYRYSLPVITTKFRLRVANFISRNYRCCILCVWCLVILVIAAGIVFSVLFGSSSDRSSLSSIGNDGTGNFSSSPAPFRMVPIGPLAASNSADNNLHGGPVFGNGAVELET